MSITTALIFLRLAVILKDINAVRGRLCPKTHVRSRIDLIRILTVRLERACDGG